MKTKTLLFFGICCIFPLVFFGQFRNIYLDIDPGNAIKNISFTTPGEGYVSSYNWIGYTQDSGHTIARKYISINNVDYNGYLVNLTFGFHINGVYILSKDSILVYGDYGFVPSILFSTDHGNTFKLIYNSTLNLSVLNNGITNMIFPEQSGIGYAVETNRILKSVDRGMTWFSILNDATAGFSDINFINNSIGFATNQGKLLKTINGGGSWQTVSVPPGYAIQSMSFINANTGWLTIDNNLYYTNDGGSSLAVKKQH